MGGREMGGVPVTVTMTAMSLNPWQREYGWPRDRGARGGGPGGWIRDPGLRKGRPVHVKWPTR